MLGQRPSLKRLFTEFNAVVQFFKAGVRDFDTTAALLPSSPMLVSAMLDPVPLERARCVVELGPGTGTLTREILKRLPQTGHVHAIELEGKLLATTAQRLNDSRLRPIHADAVDAPRLLAESRCPPCADAVISSLGLSLIPTETRETILRGVVEILSPEGCLTQYSYVHTRFFVFTMQSRYLRTFTPRPLLETLFGDVRRKFIGVNLPPAMVYACKRPNLDVFDGQPPAAGRAARVRRHLAGTTLAREPRSSRTGGG